MSKAVWIVGAVGVLTLATSSVVQFNASRELAGELALLRDEVRGAAVSGRERTAATNSPSAGANAGERASAASEDVAALREQVAALRKSADELSQLVRSAKPSAISVPVAGAAETGAGNVPAQQWKNAGKLTPEATMETVLWSALGGEVDVLANTIGFTPSARTKADAWFAGLTQPVREQYGSPEKVIALMIAKDAATLSSMEVLAQRELTPDNVGVRIRVANEQGQTKDQTYLLTRNPDGWRMMMTDSVVEKFARQLSEKK